MNILIWAHCHLSHPASDSKEEGKMAALGRQQATSEATTIADPAEKGWTGRDWEFSALRKPAHQDTGRNPPQPGLGEDHPPKRWI